MSLHRTLGVLALVSGLVAGCSNTPSQPAASSSAKSSAPSSKPMDAPAPTAPPCDAHALLSKLTLRQKLAQLLMVGVKNASDARTAVTEQQVGGIFIGSWTDMSMLQDGTIPKLQAESGALPLAVSIDEEGGRVSRLKNLIGKQESPRVLAQTKTAAEVEAIARERGQKMKDQFGITVDFAPDTDVTDEPDDEVIGDRSFGSTAEKVTEYAGAYAAGLREAGLVPVLKHFPGHGHGSGDSHTGGVVTPPLDELKKLDLVPYATLTIQQPVAVMVGHLQVPGLTQGDDPASLSKPAYDLLRSGEYGGPPFDGVVFTDDLTGMAAITQHFGVADAALKALQAGADVALWITTDGIPDVLDKLEAATKDGQLDPAQVDKSVLRVAAMKGQSAKCVK
ncbi:glycoside hydrolase family 3 protein [Mycobacterium sp. CBMA293]|uniref:glycoside hydrolase family 3 N-terminal domain-containing protein n=1 Tax=unclassified Mycolicibacterium TaxID=2636767 RepID=UPI0012DE500F|nr:MULTISPECIES: glycoside hydrolase family 3 N-terminal domain-containing protein [unclassified Mycolicibacterium]MUL47804.1 glycoside hydrolase family 3 protein [Mycolicibacterium sp. CBMA 360]MUL59349.1 glycoside hydrolase family 3 protein [Mycolicibacterium sp. CBMA 335]MUL71074.1 glycoside hydrolase family 3 protein [Mycolicibacterium sp. CBMA 311]MUL94717.1 glycoside hydrolase family 3 protein [Mycolicibacterium sp. CBMA 230]MUM09105.1 beta-glucosidase [Mycolicibacterium sp. CBMA 213]